MLGCHLSLHHDVFIFCRASSFFLPSITTDKPCRFVYESLLGHTLVQRNKHHSSTSIAFVSVCRRRPSARRADPSDGESLNTRDNQKTGTQCGAYGWWQRCNQHQQAAGHGHLTADCKVIRKSFYLCKRTPVDVQLCQGGRQADPTMHSTITSATITGNAAVHSTITGAQMRKRWEALPS